MSALALDRSSNTCNYFTPPLIGTEKRGKNMKIAQPAHHPVEPLAVGIGEAARLTGLSVATLRRRNRDGLLPMVRVGGRRLIRLTDLRRLVEASEPSPSR
jgi:excisionase family DNA binding protein